MKTKKKILVKCKRKDCKKIINTQEIHNFYKGKVINTYLEEIKGYCTITCCVMDECEKRREEEKIKTQKRRSDTRMINQAFFINKSIKELIHSGKMTESVLDKIDQEIEKVKK